MRILPPRRKLHLAHRTGTGGRRNFRGRYLRHASQEAFGNKGDPFGFRPMGRSEGQASRAVAYMFSWFSHRESPRRQAGPQDFRSTDRSTDGNSAFIELVGVRLSCPAAPRMGACTVQGQCSVRHGRLVGAEAWRFSWFGRTFAASLHALSISRVPEDKLPATISSVPLRDDPRGRG